MDNLTNENPEKAVTNVLKDYIEFHRLCYFLICFDRYAILEVLPKYNLK